MDAIDEEGLYEDISKLKICVEEKNVIIDSLQCQLAEREKHHEKLECEIVGLTKEIEKNKALNLRFVKGSETLDDIIMLEYYILQSNGTHKILQKYKHTKQERHRYTWFTQFGLRPPRTTYPSFLLSSKMKRHNLQQIRCNILCFLS